MSVIALSESVSFDGTSLVLLDQRLLPHKTEFVTCRTVAEVAAAIKNMVVRGAPAIGITAAYGLIFASDADAAAKTLKAARPTAVDLANAVDFVLAETKKGKDPKAAAIAWHEEIRRSTKRICENGASLLKDGASVLLHCNAGPIATAAYGTALGIVIEAAKTKKIFVYVDETRPRFQGTLTAYELAANGVPHKVITDSMAGHVLKSGFVDAVLVGADRITKNGDVANKIGTYSLAVLAKENRVSFYVAAPSSTFDKTLRNGKDIKIEERSEDEVLLVGSQKMYPDGTKAYNPAFDVTPAKYVSAYITEEGVKPGKRRK